MPAIRKAERNDARRLAHFAERTFRETFGPMNTAEDMDLHCRTNYSEAIQAGEIADPGMITLLSEHGTELAGFAQIRWGGAPVCVRAKSPGEIQRLYVASEWHGQGVAPALMGACLAELQLRGSDVVWLGVWERNPRAIAFYRKYGFADVGAHIFPLGRDPQRDVVLARPVSGTQVHS
jgi:ribosomal protein S18 acetylase RimI-like enzyme